LPLPCPDSNFPFGARDRKRKLHRERAVFFFPFGARDRRRKLHRERAVFFFPFGARDKRRKLHREWILKDYTYTWWEAFEHMQKLLSRK
jgi:hypothetical protein